MGLRKEAKTLGGQIKEYWYTSRHPFCSIISVLPILIFYELIALSLNQNQQFGIRNAADVILKDLFFQMLIEHVSLHTIFVIATALVAIAIFFALKDFRDQRMQVQTGYFVVMFIESLIYAVLLGPAIVEFTQILQKYVILAQPFMNLSLPHKVMLSLGAGFYEEFVFRVMMVSGTNFLMIKGLGFNPKLAGFIALLFSSILFSAFHYLGPFGEPFEMYSFIFRLMAGFIFGLLYLFRGFGIAVYTHTLYDLLIVMHQ
ncbi:CPBP family intramembrane metalloprotease [candidate division KSB1 bacterium]|nr:CPBP family intramembrane metalloprotease [candidate division KSB1 bacterium]